MPARNESAPALPADSISTRFRQSILALAGIKLIVPNRVLERVEV